MNQSQHRRLALTIGDPHGIGPEITLKALAQLSVSERERVIVYGPRKVLVQAAVVCGLESLLSQLHLHEAGTLQQPARFGIVDAAAGASTVQSATAALEACRRRDVDAVIACPHNETAIYEAGITFSGYPSLVARVCGMPEDEVFLMLVGGGLRIVHVTLHESVQQALRRINSGLVRRATEAGVRACAMLGVAQPSVALFGINPHASEGGLFGFEDEQIVVPAAQTLRAAGVFVEGPLGADMVLAKRKHDLYVAMFHDQGHIPIKLLAPQAASALSIGADVLLSSVGHGSAMDIAGCGIADPTALNRTISLLLGNPAPSHAQSPSYSEERNTAK